MFPPRNNLPPATASLQFCSLHSCRIIFQLMHTITVSPPLNSLENKGGISLWNPHCSYAYASLLCFNIKIILHSTSNIWAFLTFGKTALIILVTFNSLYFSVGLSMGNVKHMILYQALLLLSWMTKRWEWHRGKASGTRSSAEFVTYKVLVQLGTLYIQLLVKTLSSSAL